MANVLCRVKLQASKLTLNLLNPDSHEMSRN